MGSVLIIDDDRATCEILQLMLRKIDHRAKYYHTLRDGLAAVRQGDYDVVFLDVKMPDGSGLDHIKEIQEQESRPEVVIITGAGSADGAEIAIKNGAWDYLQKPLSPKKIILPIKRVLEYRENLKGAKARPNLLKRNRIIGTSAALGGALEQLSRAAQNDGNVLITGETGTGKEVFAQTLHENSNRSAQRLIVVDCAALPENLIESALFGHVRGAFTGADRAVDGLVKLADKSTLFLDEIGELSLVLQKTLLRVLQEKTFRPVGSTQEQRSDFRLVAATNRQLEQMIGAGTFREDLLFRLRSQVIEVPPLRDRPEDIEQLVIHYSRLLADKYDLKYKGFAPDFLETLASYPWPGNVRELIHAIEQAVYNSQDEPILFSKHLPEELRIKVIDTQLKGAADEVAGRGPAPATIELPESECLPSFHEFREAALDALEKTYLRQLLHRCGGDLKSAMAMARLGRTRLYTLLKKHRISR